MVDPPYVPRSQLATLPRKWTPGRIAWAAVQTVVYGSIFGSIILADAIYESLWTIPLMLLWAWIMIQALEWVIGSTIDIIRRRLSPVPNALPGDGQEARRDGERLAASNRSLGKLPKSGRSLRVDQ